MDTPPAKIWNYIVNIKLGDKYFHMNASIIISLIIAIGIFVFSPNIENNTLNLLLQPTALLIVIGGTFCASFINFSFTTVLKALQASTIVFKNKPNNKIAIIEETLKIAYYARHNSLLDLQGIIDQVQNSFLKRGLKLAIDIENPQLIYDILEAEIAYDEEQELINSRVFEAMGGYAPTFGIVGAVLGLIQVMSYIQQPEILANGIATAFVATLYGVGIANLIFLPIAGNMKLKLREEVLFKEAILQAILSIVMRENPTIIEEKLIAYLKYNNKIYPKSLRMEQKV